MHVHCILYCLYTPTESIPVSSDIQQSGKENRSNATWNAKNTSKQCHVIQQLHDL